MTQKTHLYLLWTNDNKMTAEKMVFMYTVNSPDTGVVGKGDPDHLGATAKLAAEDRQIQTMIQDAIEKGVHVTACKACTDQLEVTPIIEALGVEVIYWGVPLTNILKKNETLLTI